MNILYFTYPLSAGLILCMAIGTGIYLTKKFQLNWSLYWIGATVFILSQVGHIPFNYVLTVLFERGILPSPPPSASIIFNAIVLGLSAGLWEETARYAMYRWWTKNARSWKKGLLIGAGHGGVEAILVGLLILVNYIIMFVLRNGDPSAIVPVEQLSIAKEQISAYWSIPWHLSMLGALERAFALPLQISFSVIVLQTFLRRQKRWLWFAIAWHALIDAVAVFSVSKWGFYITEAIVGLGAIISIALIFMLRKPDETQPEMKETRPKPPLNSVSSLKEIPETSENLESTRYQ